MDTVFIIIKLNKWIEAAILTAETSVDNARRKRMKWEILGLFIEGNCKQCELGVPQNKKLENMIRAEIFEVATLVME